MKKFTGWLFVATVILMLFVNSCQRSGSIYQIDQTRCNLCKKCVLVCGYNAIYMAKSENDRDTIYINPNKCVGCGECVRVCPVDAITSASAQRNKGNDD